MTQSFRFSANTGFLYKELDFLDRIPRAAADGFDALEFHDEAQSVDRAALKVRLADAGLPVLGLNVRMGDTAGCAAIADRAEEARADIDAAIELAEDIDAGAIHVLAGKTRDPGSLEVYQENLAYALAQTSKTLLIEPLCELKMPGYRVRTVDEAAQIINNVGNDRLRIMFDCFHVQAEEGDTLLAFQRCVDKIGHVQIASWPERAEPQAGAEAEPLDYARLLPAFVVGGYHGEFGCEYTPMGGHENLLYWRELLTSSS